MTDSSQVEMVRGYSATRGRFQPLRLPRPISGENLLLIARRFESRILGGSTTPLHMIAIANSGISIASAVVARREIMYANAPTWLSIINPREQNNIISDPQVIYKSQIKTVLFDNSINSGRTMELAIEVLRKNKIPVDVVVKLVRYGDEAEREAEALVGAMFSVPVQSLFDVAEVCIVRDSASTSAEKIH
jgi:hypoxanthine phosphoribosyltransferase